MPGTALPWQHGNVGITGHRDTFFRPLRNIQLDDVITLTTFQGEYRYRVVSTKVVSPEPRDPKGIYRKARERAADTVPGLQSAYEPPENAELVVDGGRETPAAAARRVMIKLAEKGYFSDD